MKIMSKSGSEFTDEYRNLNLKNQITTQLKLLNSTQPEITDAGVWHLYVRIINNITTL